jgi:2-polyprenyl-6-methoxyphenol hydroxylase-like FAD-dependent oxidoreductase
MSEGAANGALRALVIGGGIGGLTTALALRRAGMEATVFERQDTVSKIQVGSGISIWTNAMRVLDGHGLGEQVRSIATTVNRVEHRTHDGGLLAVWPLAELEEQVGIPTASVIRSELHEILTGSLGEDTVRLGRECTGFKQDGEGVTAQFADGGEERGDILIGADGIHSAIRRLILGHDEPRYAGYVVYQGVTEHRPDAAPVGLFRMTWGPALRFNFQYVGGDHCRLYWTVVEKAPAEEPPGGPGRKARLLDLLKAWPAPAVEAVDATDEGVITRLPIYGRTPVKQWGVDRVTLVGDAAHPMTFNLGQGAGLALEDTVTLVRCLASAKDDVPGALRIYEQQRMPRAAGMMKLSWRIGVIGKWRNPVALAVRRQMMKRIFNIAWVRHQKLMAEEP